MTFPDPGGYFRHLPSAVQSPIEFWELMPDRILVVDDEEAIREIVSSMLTFAGYSCLQAASGMEALAVLNSGEEFELMLSDLMMAELDGNGLLERTKERFPDMPVVMVTAVHDISVALAALRNGAYDYLLKPFERDQLLATVGRALENRRLKLENRTYQTNLESLVEARTDQLQTAMANLERSYDITLEALGDALDLKDKENRRTLAARDCVYDCHRPRHGPCRRSDSHHRSRCLPARHRQDGDSRRYIAQTRETDLRADLHHARALLQGLSDRKEDSLLAGCLRHYLFSPRTLRRHRLPPKSEGQGDSPGGPHLRGC